MSSLKIVVLAVLLGLGLVVAILAGDWPSLVLNLGTELMGGVAIYFILDHVIGSRERREAEERELQAHKKDLIARMGSEVHDVAIAAAEELRRRGWLSDGSLKGAALYHANLSRAFLIRADLQAAHLRRADLRTAHLTIANLKGADLRRADLQRAHLQGVDLREANLRRADLQGANLRGAKFNENTTLPDDAAWTPDTDMTRFTDPKHPQFWWSDDPRSLAYRAKETG